MANEVRGRLDAVEGFTPFEGEQLNRLPNQRFFTTWFDSEPLPDEGRAERAVFALSTLPQKFLPYRPRAIEPTILSEQSGPLRYIHRVVSHVHLDDPLQLVFSPVDANLSPLEKISMERYLHVPLTEPDKDVFAAHLTAIMDQWELQRNDIVGPARNSYMETILAILMSFSDYQYNLNTNTHISVSGMVHFLQHAKEGDCVEFSNTAALLARLAGIPSRVATGYLAARGLQTQAHRRGLAALRSRIPVLGEFPPNDLYLVTDAHGHAWPQFYVPGYGWLDFEATMFAIPPLGLGDGNMRDVVIPLIDTNQVFAPVRAFPWRAVLRALAAVAFMALKTAYTLRYGREAVLYLRARRGGRAGARALYLLLLARLAADGKPLKPASKTAVEYAQLFPVPAEDTAAGEGGLFAQFARRYSELRWRHFDNAAEADARFAQLQQTYRALLAAHRRTGLVAAFRRALSLRGLAYL
jgi:transglutaminase-like putative cysteine protease